MRSPDIDAEQPSGKKKRASNLGLVSYPTRKARRRQLKAVRAERRVVHRVAKVGPRQAKLAIGRDRSGAAFLLLGAAALALHLLVLGLGVWAKGEQGEKQPPKQTIAIEVAPPPPPPPPPVPEALPDVPEPAPEPPKPKPKPRPKKRRKPRSKAPPPPAAPETPPTPPPKSPHRVSLDCGSTRPYPVGRGRFRGWQHPHGQHPKNGCGPGQGGPQRHGRSQ